MSKIIISFIKSRIWFTKDVSDFIALYKRKILKINKKTKKNQKHKKTNKKQEMFQKHIRPPWCKIQVYLLCRNKTCSKQVIKGLKYIKWTTHSAQEWFDLDLWICDLKINRNNLLIGCNPCTKFGIDQVKRSKDIERT